MLCVVLMLCLWIQFNSIQFNSVRKTKLHPVRTGYNQCSTGSSIHMSTAVTSIGYPIAGGGAGCLAVGWLRPPCTDGSFCLRQVSSRSGPGLTGGRVGGARAPPGGVRRERANSESHARGPGTWPAQRRGAKLARRRCAAHSCDRLVHNSHDHSSAQSACGLTPPWPNIRLFVGAPHCGSRF